MHAREPTTANTLCSAGSRQPEQVSERSSGTVPFILGSVILGTIGIFVHEANADPITATWFRCAFGLLALTLWLAVRKDLSKLRLAGSNGVWVLIAAVLMVLAWTMFFAAIQRMSAGLATVLFHVQPLWVLGLSAWLLGERVARQRLLGILLAMAGLVLATGLLEEIALHRAPGGIGLKSEYGVGVVLCLLGALCTACVTLIAKRAGDRPAAVFVWWQCALGMLALLWWPMAHGWPSWGTSWIWLSGLGLLHTGLAYSLMYMGISHMKIDRVAVFQFIYPALVIVFDWLVYGLRLGPSQLIGVAIMALAIWYAEHGANAR